MPRVGICPATLVADPLRADDAEIGAALDAAAAAGFESVSWWALHQLILGEGADRALEDRGLRAGAVEVALAWPAGDEAAIDAELASLAPLVERWAPEVLVAVTLDPTIDEAAATAGLARLGAWAAERSMHVALEFLPWTAVASVHDAHRLTAATGDPAVGILLDTWHWARQPSGTDLAQLDEVDVERVYYVQLDDAPDEPAHPDLYTETMTARLAPGEGDVDLVGILTALRAGGADPYIAPEVFNTELFAAGVDAMAQHLFDTTQHTLEAAGWT
ncbi:MAG: sugar phosphate isomerase/epimerase [Acidimicrobiia bacterium]|nr:sugar phosphate isomerase/epimerase [Acidimicrobiia bacterium]